MPKTIKNDAGEEEEVYTKEELEAQSEEKTAARLAAEREKFEQEKADEITQKEEELKLTKEKLQKLEEKDHNFEQLRKKINSKNETEEGKVLKEEVAKLQKALDDLSAQPIKDAHEEFVNTKLAQADKDTKDKFDFYYKKLGSEAKTKGEAQKAMAEALKLADPERKFDEEYKQTQVGVDENFAKVGTEQETQTSKEFGGKMNLSEEDKKKYGKINGMDLMKPNVGVAKK